MRLKTQGADVPPPTLPLGHSFTPHSLGLRRVSQLAYPDRRDRVVASKIVVGPSVVHRQGERRSTVLRPLDRAALDSWLPDARRRQRSLGPPHAPARSRLCRR